MGFGAIEEILGFLRAERAVLGAGLGSRIAFEELLLPLPTLHRGRRTDQVAALAFLHLPRDLPDAGMGADNARDRVLIRDGERFEAQKRSAIDIFLRMAGAGEEAEVRGNAELGKTHGRFLPLSRKPERICVIAA